MAKKESKAELLQEQAQIADRIAELDRRLADEDSSLAELQLAGDELASAHRLSRAIDARLAGIAAAEKEAAEAAQLVQRAKSGKKFSAREARMADVAKAHWEQEILPYLDDAQEYVANGGGRGTVGLAYELIKAYRSYLKKVSYREQAGNFPPVYP